jgi:hypothetical protein
MQSQTNIGKLAISGDWACVHGDLALLGDIARRIAECVAEPLHCELVGFADLCLANPARACHQWPHVRERLIQAAR